MRGWNGRWVNERLEWLRPIMRVNERVEWTRSNERVERAWFNERVEWRVYLPLFGLPSFDLQRLAARK